MKHHFSRNFKYLICLFVFFAAFSLFICAGDGEIFRSSVVEAKVTQESSVFGSEHVVFGRANPNIRAVIAVQNRYTEFLLEEPGILGTATGLTKDGRPAILVFAKSYELARTAAIPASIEDVPVIVKITGQIKALKAPSSKGKVPKPSPVDPTARFDRPVPIGVSTGHPAITAGTIGCRVTDGIDVYALSNNHVYADENKALPGEDVLQPGTYDGGEEPADSIGTLFDFQPIVFSTLANNEIDAAIALSSTAELGNATPSDGYGKPKSTPVDAKIGLTVMKYGRTTSQTKGKVYAINATVDVSYDTGVARFVNQIVITPGNFSAPGDSGSLIVVQKGKDARKPVGLLFAGGGGFTFANPIDSVLNMLGVTIDGD